jgi:hypothetical protein
MMCSAHLKTTEDILAYDHNGRNGAMKQVRIARGAKRDMICVLEGECMWNGTLCGVGDDESQCRWCCRIGEKQHTSRYLKTQQTSFS